MDIHKLKAGNGLAQFFALYVDFVEHQNALQRCLSMLDAFFIKMEPDSTTWNYTNGIDLKALEEMKF